MSTIPQHWQSKASGTHFSNSSVSATQTPTVCLPARPIVPISPAIRQHWLSLWHSSLNCSRQGHPADGTKALAEQRQWHTCLILFDSLHPGTECPTWLLQGTAEGYMNTSLFRAALVGTWRLRLAFSSSSCPAPRWV